MGWEDLASEGFEVSEFRGAGVQLHFTKLRRHRCSEGFKPKVWARPKGVLFPFAFRVPACREPRPCEFECVKYNKPREMDLGFPVGFPWVPGSLCYQIARKLVSNSLRPSLTKGLLSMAWCLT